MTKRILSKHRTAVAYGGDVNPIPQPHTDGILAGTRVELQPGENIVTDDQLASLEADKNFKRHEAGGYVAVLPDEDPLEADAPPIQINSDGLRTDGPTLAQYVAAGYDAANYPPKGYMVVEDPNAPAPPATKPAKAPKAAKADPVPPAPPSEPARPDGIDAAFLQAYDALASEDQAALYATLGDPQKVFLDARKAGQ